MLPDSRLPDVEALKHLQSRLSEVGMINDEAMHAGTTTSTPKPNPGGSETHWQNLSTMQPGYRRQEGSDNTATNPKFEASVATCSPE